MRQLWFTPQAVKLLIKLAFLATAAFRMTISTVSKDNSTKTSLPWLGLHPVSAASPTIHATMSMIQLGTAHPSTMTSYCHWGFVLSNSQDVELPTNSSSKRWVCSKFYPSTLISGMFATTKSGPSAVSPPSCLQAKTWPTLTFSRSSMTTLIASFSPPTHLSTQLRSLSPHQLLIYNLYLCPSSMYLSTLQHLSLPTWKLNSFSFTLIQTTKSWLTSITSTNLWLISPRVTCKLKGTTHHSVSVTSLHSRTYGPTHTTPTSTSWIKLIPPQ